MVAMTLMEFLLARLAEDQQVAQAATPGAWLVTIDPLGIHVENGDGKGRIVMRSGRDRLDGRGRPDADHIARHDPARVLRQVAATRRLLQRHHPKDDPPWGVVCEGCGYEGPNDNPRSLIDECPELRDLAAVYVDHPDYREEWRP